MFSNHATCADHGHILKAGFSGKKAANLIVWRPRTTMTNYQVNMGATTNDYKGIL